MNARLLIATVALALLFTTGCLIRSGPGDESEGSTASSGGSSSSGSSAIVVENASGRTICYAYISASSDSNWGPDRLGSDVISPGESYGMPVSPGTYDFKLEDCDHNELLDRRAIAVSGTGVALTYR